MRYVLNSAVVTSPGRYVYRLVTAGEAGEWLRSGPFTSTVGYEETAEALRLLTGVAIPVDRRQIKMAPGDEALVFRLVFPPGTPRLPADRKGVLTPEWVLGHCEAGVLLME